MKKEQNTEEHDFATAQEIGQEKSSDDAADLAAAANSSGFSSEKFKLEVKNLPKNFGFGDFKKFLNSLNLKYVKIKSPGNGTFAFVTFVDEEAKLEAKRVLNESKFKGKQLEAVHAKPAMDPITANALKRKNENETDLKNKKTIDENLSLEERVKNSTIPLWNTSYDKQVEQKTTEIKQLLRKAHFKIDKANEDIFYFLQQQKAKYEGMCCELTEFFGSPVIDKYRNKCEFTIGYDLNETKSVIGFRLGDYKSGSNEVVEPYCCGHIADETKLFIKKFQEYLEQSEYKAYNVRTHEGHWRQLTIRNNQNNDLLVIVIFDNQDLTREQVTEEKKKLADFFRKYINNETPYDTSDPESIRLKGLLFNLNTNKSGISKMDNLDVLVGEDV